MYKRKFPPRVCWPCNLTLFLSVKKHLFKKVSCVLRNHVEFAALQKEEGGGERSNEEMETRERKERNARRECMCALVDECAHARATKKKGLISDIFMHTIVSIAHRVRTKVSGTFWNDSKRMSRMSTSSVCLYSIRNKSDAQCVSDVVSFL